MYPGATVVVTGKGAAQDVRVSDAEREAAASSLGNHLATGRLDVAEYEERVGRAWSARYRGELAALFTDLPAVQRAVPGRRGPRPFVLAPILLALIVIAGVFAVIQALPWLLIVFVGMMVFSHRRRRARYRSYYATTRWSA